MSEIKVAKILIENEENEFLTLQKADNYDWMAEKWELPGGKLEEGEDRFRAVKREVKNETGLEIREVEDVVRVEVEEFNDEKPIVDCFILHTDEFSGEVETSGEHQGLNWVSAEEFREMDWHRDAGYAIPAMEFLKDYMG